LPTPYDWSFDKILGVFRFQGNNGADYEVALKEAGDVYFSNFPEIKSLSYEIAFESSRASSHYDERVSLTIVEIVKAILQKGSIIIFVCESRDEKQNARHKLFANWFKKYGDGFEKYDFEFDDERPYYLSLLLDANKHTRPQLIIDEFERTIDEYCGYKNT